MGGGGVLFLLIDAKAGRRVDLFASLHGKILDLSSLQ